MKHFLFFLPPSRGKVDRGRQAASRMRGRFSESHSQLYWLNRPLIRRVPRHLLPQGEKEGYVDD